MGLGAVITLCVSPRRYSVDECFCDFCRDPRPLEHVYTQPFNSIDTHSGLLRSLLSLLRSPVYGAALGSKDG